MNELEQLIHDTPNNMQLGEIIREKYSHLKKQEFMEGTVYPVSNKHYLSKTLLEMGESSGATVNNRRQRVTGLNPETQLELPLSENPQEDSD